MRTTWILVCAALVLATVPGDVDAGGHGKKQTITLKKVWTYASGIFDESAAEIVAFDPKSKRFFVTNSDRQTVDVLRAKDGAKIGAIDVSAFGEPNSVAVNKGVVAVALAAEPAQRPGKVAFYEASTLAYVNAVTVGALPDMLTYTPNGNWLLVACEGEPNDDYDVDPEGTVSVVDVRKGPMKATVRSAGFTAWNPYKAWLQAQGVRIFGPGATVAQDLEPEYITVGSASRVAWVALQENNALGLLDIRRARFLAVLPLGTKNHDSYANALDASNRDDEINITTWPTRGMYQPDAIAAYRTRGRTYVVTVNEGDARDYDGFSEEERVKDLTLDPTAFPDAATLQEDENLGRLKTTTANGDTDGDGDFDEIYSYGARSLSIWTAWGKLVWDSGDDFEQIIADAYPAYFNSNNDDNDSFDSRSDDKGPEPEALAVGRIGPRWYAFAGLERMGGIMVYDITNPKCPTFVDYVLDRDFSGDPETGTAGDLGPEGLAFIPRGKSPFGVPLLCVANEVSATTTLYRIDVTR